MIPTTEFHWDWLTEKGLLAPVNIATVEGDELVANATLTLEHAPVVDQLNDCGNVTVAPEDGLLRVATQDASRGSP